MNEKLQKFEDAVMDLVSAAIDDGVSRDEVVSVLEVVTMTTKEADDIGTD